MPSRTPNNPARWLELQEARLNPPLDESDDEFVDPFAHLPDADADTARKLRLMFEWVPPRDRLH